MQHWNLHQLMFLGVKYYVVIIVFLFELLTMIEIESQAATVIGLLVAVVAVVGTQVFGWEWGDGRLIPTFIGVAAAGMAVFLIYRRYAETD